MFIISEPALKLTQLSADLGQVHNSFVVMFCESIGKVCKL